MTLTAERWARVQELFHAALERPAAARAAFVAGACAADAALAAEVRSLLAAHERGGPVPDTAPEPPPPSLQWVGPYRLIREVGRGGMGTVFLAERAGEGFTQRVALKLLRSDFADARLAARLAAERRILARLEHPGIARFIDGGTTGAGQPYVAMEYVEGSGLLAYSAARALDLRARLELFARICDAVQYAHSQLVVHRDLKPGNILVTADGRPKLLDFGVAKILDDSGGEATLTHTGLWATPAYASPEQLRQQPVTALTDVYTLGVILHELLTGRLPYAVEGTLAEMIYVVCEVAPEPPSAAAPPGVARAVAGDLDTIVLKALAKEPERRYGSVEQLGEDVRRFLDGRPVLARPDSLGYRARKFARRHRAAVTAAGLLLGSLVAGIAATAWQAAVARRERDRAEEALRRSEDVTAFLLDLFAAADPRRAPGDTLAGRTLLRQGLARVEELADQPAVQASMLDALGLVLVSIGQYERALELIQRGLRLRREVLGASHPDVPLSLRSLARVRRAVGDYAGAEAALREALAIEERVFGPEHPRAAETLSELGFLMPYMGRSSEASYRRALAIRRAALGDEHPLVAASLKDVAAAARQRGDVRHADSLMRAALALQRRALGPEHPDVAQTMLHLGDLLMAQGRPAEAERLFRDAMAIQRRTLGPRHPILAHALGSLSDVLVARGDFAGAAALLREDLAIQLDLFGPDHAGVASSLGALANVMRRAGRLAAAESLATASLATWRRAMGPEHSTVGSALFTLADVVAARGDYDEAERLVRQGLAIKLARHGRTHGHVSGAWLQLARYRLVRRDYGGVERLARDALDLLTRAGVGPTHEQVREAHRLLAEAYDATGRTADAARHRALAAPETGG